MKKKDFKVIQDSTHWDKWFLEQILGIVQVEEHLKTNASVPYRDPNSNSSSKEILERRKKEQKSSEFMATNLWKKKWEITKCK